ncbi:MAG: hypothetical protein U1E15_14160 [Hyphomicrobiales bacterium]
MIPRLRAFAAALAAALCLAGCVLQSEQPLLTEEQGVAALADLGSRFAPYTFERGAWQSDDAKPADFNFTGHHYDVPGDDGKTSQVLFVPLKDKWWALQMSEAGKEFTYSLAERQGQELLLHPLMCEELQKDKLLAPRIHFENGDCQAPADFGLKDMLALTERAPPGFLKLVPVK